MKILVIAAHPDDEIIGVGATISWHIENGDDVYVHIVSEGVSAQYKDKKKYLKIRRDSCLAAAKYLGVKKVYFDNYPDGKLSLTSPLKINNSIEKVINTVKPKRVYTHHWGDIHKDHQAVYEASLVASRKSVKELFCYEIIGTSKNKENKKIFNPTYYVPTKQHIKKKIKALSYYYSEVKKFPNPLSYDAVNALAKIRGVEAGIESAEAFVCVKQIEE